MSARNSHPGRDAVQLHPRLPRPRVRPRGPDPQGRRRRVRPRPRGHRLLQLPRLPGDRRLVRGLVPRPRRRGRARDHVARRERRHRHPPRSSPHAGRADRVHDAADQGGREARLPDRSRADLAHARLDGGAARRSPRSTASPSRSRCTPTSTRRTRASSRCATGTRRSARPFLGFTADWGATVSGFAPSLLEAYRRRGASDELLGKVVDLWNTYYEQGPPADQAEHGQRFGSFIGLAAQNGRPDLGIDFAHQRHRPVRPRAGRRLARDHAVDPARARQVLRHRRERRGALGAGARPHPSAGRERLLRRDLERVRGLALELLAEPVRHHRAASRPCSGRPRRTPARA